jgi:SAM-dependent methyltransferase
LSGCRVTPSWPRFFLETELIKAIEGLRPGRLRCLNLGSGPSGRYRELFGNWEIVAADIQPPAGPQPWRYCRADAGCLPFKSRCFDVVVAIEAFEHIHDNAAAMREVHRVMKPEGRLIVTTPTHWTWMYELGRHGPHYYSRRALLDLVIPTRLVVDEVVACGGAMNFATNLVKSWASFVGVRAAKDWWALVDEALTPAFWLASRLDTLLPVLPANWVLQGHRPPDA